MKKLVYGLFTLTALSSAINLAYADTNTPKFDCTLTDQVSDDGKVGDKKDSFIGTTPTVYLVCQSDAVKKGEQVKASWIAADTNNVAPPNYKIDESTLNVPQDPTNGQVWTAKFSLSKPNNGWPVGTYRVDISVDGTQTQSVPFTVK